jgi:hypothetical protein
MSAAPTHQRTGRSPPKKSEQQREHGLERRPQSDCPAGSVRWAMIGIGATVPASTR